MIHARNSESLSTFVKVTSKMLLVGSFLSGHSVYVEITIRLPLRLMLMLLLLGHGVYVETTIRLPLRLMLMLLLLGHGVYVEMTI